MRFSSQRRAIFQHVNFKKCSEHDSFLAFWLVNALLTTAARNFSHIGTSESAPRRSVFLAFWLTHVLLVTAARNFSHIGTSKSAPKRSVFSILRNVLLATAACNFSTCQLQKVFRAPQLFDIFTWKWASRHSGVQFLLSPLTTWLRTRRFNEPTFRLTWHTNHQNNTAFREFSNIWRRCLFFFLIFTLLYLPSSDFTSSHPLFICFFNSPYCRKFAI